MHDLYSPFFRFSTALDVSAWAVHALYFCCIFLGHVDQLC